METNTNILEIKDIKLVSYNKNSKNFSKYSFGPLRCKYFINILLLYHQGVIRSNITSADILSHPLLNMNAYNVS